MFGTAIVFFDKIDLVVNDQMRRLLRQARKDFSVAFANAGLAVDNEDNGVGAVDFSLDAVNADSFDFIIRITQAGGIDDMQRNAFDMQSPADDITRGAGNWRNDGQFVANQTVE